MALASHLQIRNGEVTPPKLDTAAKYTMSGLTACMVSIGPGSSTDPPKGRLFSVVDSDSMSAYFESTSADGRADVIIKTPAKEWHVSSSGGNAGHLYITTSGADGGVVYMPNVVICAPFGIEGPSTASSTYFSDGTEGAPSISFSSDLNTGIYRSGTDELSISTSGITRMTFAAGCYSYIPDNHGMVIGGATQQTIGSVVPSLQVLGTAAPDSRISAARFSADDGASYISFLKSRNASIGSNTIVEDDDQIGVINFYVDDGNDYNSSVAQILIEVDDASPAQDQVGGAMVFATTATTGNSPIERLRIDASGAVSFLGSAGSILTTVGQNGGGSTNQYFQLVSEQYDAAETEGFQIMETFSNGTNNQIVIGGGSADYNAANLIYFYTGANDATRTGTSRMMINGSGNVGIGTNTPAVNLTVEISDSNTGAIAASAGQYALQLANTDGTNDTWSLITFSNEASSGTPSVAIGAQFTDTGNDYGDIVIGGRGAGGWGEWMRIDSSGNVGIGTAVAITRLDARGARHALYGVATILSSDAQAAGEGGELTFGGKYTDAGGEAIWASIGAYKENSTSLQTGAYMTFDTQPNGGSITERIRITSGGNVGIGTAAPVTQSGWGAPWLTVASTDPGFILMDSNHANNSRYMSNGGGTLRLGHMNDDGTGGVAHVTVDVSGNVCIIGNLCVGGTLGKAAGSFVINHPCENEKKPNKYNAMNLIHGFEEGPKYGIFYEGEAELCKGIATVQLPSYFNKLVNRKDGIYIQITGLGEWTPLTVMNSDCPVCSDKFKVCTIDDGVKNAKFSWRLSATRGDKYVVNDNTQTDDEGKLIVEQWKSHDQIDGKEEKVLVTLTDPELEDWINYSRRTKTKNSKELFSDDGDRKEVNQIVEAAKKEEKNEE